MNEKQKELLKELKKPKSSREKNIQDIKIAFYNLKKIIDDDKELKQLSDFELKEVRKLIGGAWDFLLFNHIK